MNKSKTASSTRRCRAFQLSFRSLGFWFLMWAPAIGWGQATSIDWMDFESPGLASQWQVRGNIQLSRDDVPPDVPHDGPQGKMLTLAAEARAMAMTRHDTWPLPTQLDKCESVTFWVRNLDPSQQPLVFDIVFPEADLRGAFWRKVEVHSHDWQAVRVPLPWMRWETGRVPRWNQVSSFAIRTRGPTKFCIDQIVFHDDDAQQFADYSIGDLAELAFGQHHPVARVVEDGGFWLLTDEPQLDVQALQARLSEVLTAMQHDLALARDSLPPRLIVFSRDADYRRFVVRFAERLGASASSPTSDGYHLQGIALSSWDAAQGTLRPVYTHEFCHSVLSFCAGIDSSKSDWWQEGVANYYQLRFHPQQNLSQIVRQGLGSEQLRTPWAELCAGGDVPLDRYWQVATLLGMLLEREEYRSRLPSLMEAFRAAGSTDLRPHLESVFGKTWEQLDAEWQQWCRGKY